MSQTAYITYQVLGNAGMLADNGEDDTLTYISEEATAVMPFGVIVKKGAADQGMLLPTTNADVLIGVTVHSHQVDPYQVALQSGAVANGGIVPKYTASVLKRGRIIVQVEEAVTPASPVFYRYASGAGGTQKGNIRASADTATAAAAGAGWRFLTTAAAAGYAVLEVNLPQ